MELGLSLNRSSHEELSRFIDGQFYRLASGLLLERRPSLSDKRHALYASEPFENMSSPDYDHGYAD